jgi:endonuclease YncB( thermonuclease family)
MKPKGITIKEIKMKYRIIPNETKFGIVKAVHDGDSIKVKFEDGEIVWIRLYGCDAPEVHSNYVSARQPYGKESGDHLRDLVKGNQVKVETLFRDQFQRMICKVEFAGKDLSETLIETGNAWWLVEPKQSPEVQSKLKELHNTAKANKVGLWGELGRKIRPSTWRSRHRIFGMVENIFEGILE